MLTILTLFTYKCQYVYNYIKMKENLIEKESEELISEEIYEIENKNKKNNSKEINLSIFNYNTNKLEKYKLLNEEDELLLCKEEPLNQIKSKKENKDEDVKIKELYKGEDNNSLFYLNKKELKKKYLKIEENLNEDKEDRNSILDNQNEKEMEKLYKESVLKHPRKIVDGQIIKYNFFSFSGFFCCNRRDYLNLGQAYITYFNTVKLLIIIFVIMTLIHLALIKFCYQFSSVYNFNDDYLLKTTLGNTIITYFNTTHFFFEKNKDYSSSEITFDCGENLIGDFIGAIRHYDIDQNNFSIIQKGRAENEFYINKNNGTILDMQYISDNFYHSKYDNDYKRKRFKILTKEDISDNINFYGSKTNNFTNKLNYMYNYFIDFSKNFEYYSYYGQCYYYYENLTDIYYYTCMKNMSSINNINQNQYYDYYFFYYDNFEQAILITSLISLIVVIVFYFIYKKGISRDKKESQKNKILINNYTLVLHKLKINSDDFNQEINDLISFLNGILKNYKHLFISSDNNNSKEITDLNIFDISLSNVNEKKVELFEKIKSLEDKIEDIINDNDTIKNKFKNNLRGFYQSMHDFVVDDSEIKGKDDKIKEENLNKDEITPEIEEGYNLEKQIKIGKTKTQKNEMTSKITTDVIEMHKEYKLSNYVDIYITFRNQKIPIFLYDMYNRRKIIRFFYFLFCQGKKIKKYYYKNQWLNFNLAKENPSDIKWENCYISTGKKWGRRLLSILISFIFIAIITAIMSALNIEENQLNSIIVVILTQGINLGSSYVL